MKDGQIEHLLFALQQALGREYFDMVDHWEDDLNAVGVAHPLRHKRLFTCAQ